MMEFKIDFSGGFFGAGVGGGMALQPRSIRF